VTAFVAFALYYCIKQRRRGAREAKLAEQRQVNERMELEQFKKAGIDPDSFVVANAEYNAKDMRRDGLADKDSYSVPGTPLDGVNEKSWSPIDGAGLGAAAAAPPLRSPVGHVPSPGPGGFNSAGYGRVMNPPDRMGSPAHMASPIRAGPPGMPPSFPPPASPAHRSFSSPNPHMRDAPPGQHMGGYQGINRTQSPAQMTRPPPQRSFTGGGGYNGDRGGYGDARYGDARYGGGQGGGQGGYGGQRGNEHWR